MHARTHKHTHAHNYTLAYMHAITRAHKHTCCCIHISYASQHTQQKQARRESTRNRTHMLTHPHIKHGTHMHNIHDNTHTNMHAPSHKHTCCCIQMSYVSARTHTHKYTHTRPQAWRARAPADSGQRHQAYIHAIMSNQSSSHTHKSLTFKIQSSHSCLNPNPLAHVQVVMYMLLARYDHTQAWKERESTHARTPMHTYTHTQMHACSQ